jgi:hypothetical protein
MSCLELKMQRGDGAKMESQPAIQVPDDARCKRCGYWLRGNTSARCPECGREFNPADATTFDYGNWKRANKLVEGMIISLTIEIILVWLLLISGAADLRSFRLVVAIAAALAAVVTVCLQTLAARMLLPKGDAGYYLMASLILVPIIYAGPILIPLIVLHELRSRLRKMEKAASPVPNARPR